jgi:hypothetical protein
MKDETEPVAMPDDATPESSFPELRSPEKPFRKELCSALAGAILMLLFSSGCGALLLVGGAGTSAIAFATGELRTEEEASLAELDVACQAAVERLDFDDVLVERTADRIRFKAVTPGGEPVVIRLIAEGPEKTGLRIRIGTFGDEAVSRLVLEEIHQSL